MISRPSPVREPAAIRAFPLFLVQPALRRIVRCIAVARSELFERLGPYRMKRFLIDPTDMPFVLLLLPDPRRPQLRAFRRGECPGYDARIAGTLNVLVEMVKGRLDGDALMFSRTLVVEGDTEAIVRLRNAIDDLDGDLMDEAAAAYGSAGRAVLRVVRRVRKRLHAKNDIFPKHASFHARGPMDERNEAQARG